MRASAVVVCKEDPPFSDRAWMLRQELHRARLDMVTACIKARRAADSPDRIAEADAAAELAAAAGRVSGFARLLAQELAG